MFDFSPSAILLAQPWLAPLYLAWLAFAPAAWTLAAVGGALVASSLIGAAWLPGFIRRPALWGGVAAIVVGLGWQAVQAEAVRQTERVAHELSLAAERARTREAQDQNRRDKEQAERDRAADSADMAELKRLLNEERKRPGAGSVVLPRAVARRLRAL